MPSKYQIRYEGIDGSETDRFSTLEAVAQFVKDRWQGSEYADGQDAFHTDYARYTLRGCTLADVGFDWTAKYREAVETDPQTKVTISSPYPEGNEDHFTEQMATPAEADFEEVRNTGMDNTKREWILTDRDVWHRNPYYVGPRTAHPDDCEQEVA